MTLPAGAALGSTTDPKALIKGEPAQVRADATALSAESRRVSGLADQVRGVTVAGWSGGYGEPAYAASRAAELDKWRAYADMLSKAGSALATYAGALTTAQSKAADAITKWQQGQDATAAAVTDYNNAVNAYNDYVNRQVCVPTYGGGRVTPSMGPARPGPFSDPGQALRDEAQQILDDARDALDEAGQAALQELGGLPGAKTEGSSGPGASGEVEGPSINWGDWSRTFGKNPSKGADGRYAHGLEDSPFAINLGKVEGEAHAWGAEGKVEDYWGNVKVDADGKITVLGADGGAGAKIDANGLVAEAHAGVTLVAAEGHAGGQWGVLEGKVGAEGSVGADAKGDLALGPQGVHAGGEVFAGAKGEVSASGSAAGVGAEGKAEGWAGIGASGDIDVGMHDGKFVIGGSGGLAFGLGGKLEGHITIDPEDVMHTGEDVVHAIGDFLS